MMPWQGTIKRHLKLPFGGEADVTEVCPHQHETYDEALACALQESENLVDADGHTEISAREITPCP